MYRPTNKASKIHSKSYTNRNSHTSQQESFVPPKGIPKLRRVIEIADFGSGKPITHKRRARACTLRDAIVEPNTLMPWQVLTS